MRTTLVIDDGILGRLQEESRRQGRTLSELVEAALRLLLERDGKKIRTKELPPLPTFDSRPRVDVADRTALYRATGGRW